MLRWYPGILLQVVLELTFVPIVFLSIFGVNTLADRNTPWAIGEIKGTGMSPGFWMFFVVLALGWTLLALGWRGAKMLFKCLLVLWHVGLTTAFLVLVLQPGDSEIRGETVGFALSLELLGPIFSIITLICAIVWIIGDLRKGTRERSVSPLQPRNKLAACCAVVGLAISGCAYWLDYDQIGTMTGILTALAMHEAIRPVNPSKELHKALLFEGSAPR